MGITIHYKGTAKSVQAIDELVIALSVVAQEFNWRYQIINKPVKGKFEPFWGIGYGFIPSHEMIQKDKIEFFQAMASKQDTGYYQIFPTKYADEVRASLHQGLFPRFTIDTVQKGIIIQVHPKCESLCFLFDLKTHELAAYEIYPSAPGITFGYNKCSCKTQFAGYQAHMVVCQILWWAEKYINFSEVNDEADYYKTKDEALLKRRFSSMDHTIQSLGAVLKHLSEKFGLTVTTGEVV